MLDGHVMGDVGSAALRLLIEAAWKGTAVLALGAALVLALGRASAAFRHLVWSCALAGIALLPGLLTTLPAWRVSAPALTWLAPDLGPPPPATAARSGSIPQAGDPLVGDAAPAQRAQATSAVGPSAPPTAPPATPGIASAPRRALDPAHRPEVSWAAVALTVWVLGALGVLATFLAGHLVLRRLLRGARPVRDGEWHSLAVEAAGCLGLTLPFVLLRGDAIPVPMALGLLRPRVLLPAEADAWPIGLRRAVLLHELAHVQRHDCLTQAAAQLACVMFWFHPGVWWAASRLRAERERACDDRVLAARTRASDYADHLLGIVRSLRAERVSALGAVAFAGSSSLEGRLLAVLDPRRDRRAVGARVAAPAALVATLLVLPFAALEPAEARTARTPWTKAVRSEGADPDALRPSRVVAVPETERSLEERVAWAGAHATRSHERVWWIGWRIETAPTLKGNLLSDSEGIRLALLARRGVHTLEDVLAGREQGTSNTHDPSRTDAREGGPAAVLVRIAAGAPDRVRVQSPGLPVEFWGEPLYWVDAVGDEQSFAWLRAAADHAGDERLRARFVESIGFMRRSDLVTPFLIATLESSAPAQVRIGAAEALSHHPSSEGVRLLAGGARSDRSPEVRRAYVEALGRFQTREALEALLAVARAGEGHEEARRAAFDALGEKVSRQGAEDGAPDVEAALEHPPRSQEAATRRAEQDEATRRDREAGPPDPVSSRMPAGQLEVQRQAIESLGRYPEVQSLPQLRRVAETSPYGDLRAEAVESIGRLGSPRALALLEEIAWKNRHPLARERAVEVMGQRFPADQVLDRLLHVAESHPSPEARRMAVEVMGRLESPRALEVLHRVVSDGVDAESQRQAVESLGRRDEDGIESELARVARTHRLLEVRRQAVESLGRRAGEHIAGLLLEIARREGPEEVQRQATESLGRLDDARVRSMLVDLARHHASIEVERQAVESLGKLAADVLPDLAQIARSHASSEVRRQAVESMTRRDPDKALPLIEEILRGAPPRNGP